MKKRKGWNQNLDNGVMKRPDSPFTHARTSKSMDFESIIAGGENSNGQTTIAPAEIARGGQCKGYRSYRFGGNTDGEAWNKNPILND